MAKHNQKNDCIFHYPVAQSPS